MKFEVSIVIPVYNAEKFIRKAVDSALQQPETREVVLVEDGSRDKSLEVCKALEQENVKVKLVQHPGGENKGAGATRNLGLQEATCPYIAFLDADDYFLPNRFSETRQVFLRQENADGVYEAITVIEESTSKQKLFTISSNNIPPEKLFHFLLRGTYGHFSTDGIVFKKSLLLKTGLFNAELKLHQDSELWLRFAYHGKLYPGKLTEPVTMARRHGTNRITHANDKSRKQFWSEVLNYYSSVKISRLDYALIIRKYCKISARLNNTHMIREVGSLCMTQKGMIRKLLMGY